MKSIIVRSLGIIFLVMTAYGGYTQDREIMISNWQVSLQEHHLLMHWTSDAQKASGIFEVQNSSDGVHFQTMAYIFGPDPASNGLDYACKASIQPETDVAFYRIKYIDGEGNVELGSIKKFKIQPKGS